MKANQVVTNIAQDFTKAEKAQGRANIDAAEVKGFVECYRRFNDGTWTDTWFKICELEPGTSDSYSYGYELALKFVVTNNGGGDCPCESATLNMGCNFIPAINVARCEVAWSDHTANDHAECAITGVKVLTRRASNNYGPRDKMELWVKTSQYFTYYTQMRVECIANAGNYCYRGTYSTPSMYVLPFTFRNSLVTGTHTDPFNDSDHPAASGYGAAGWSEVWYPCETKTVMVDHAQDFTEAEKQQGRDNIGAADGKISWVEYHEGTPTPTVVRSGISVVTSDRGTRIQDDGASSQFFVAPNYTSGDYDKVLTVTQGGGVKWEPIPNPEIPAQEDWKQMRSASEPNPTYSLETIQLCNNNEYDKIWGSITLKSNTSGNFSLCPADSNGYASRYGSQCVNLGALPTNEPFTFNFLFDSKGNLDITHLCIKGQSSGSDVDVRYLITQLQKKES